MYVLLIYIHNSHNIRLVWLLILQLLELKDELLKHALPPNVLMKIALCTTKVYRRYVRMNFVAILYDCHVFSCCKQIVRKCTKVTRMRALLTQPANVCLFFVCVMFSVE